METTLKVLLMISDSGRLRIPKIFLIPIAGFARLRRAGYIKIQKENAEFYAYLTPKGVYYLRTESFCKTRDIDEDENKTFDPKRHIQQ
ncbi:hypothetical protein QG516_03280 [Pedobacter gandavensis]|uniref:hypothetical protein n=1 Tax=Pedobacter gandavensis TaxID=2679963 RepID=UPI0024783F22|nr:hypothetical protein [Pedobacter gandavensis]WGQ10676.1 hypothetical protein QG516_03280 [Pedobacter gandavensis]